MLTIRIKTDDYLQQKFIFDLLSFLTFFMNTLCANTLYISKE